MVDFDKASEPDPSSDSRGGAEIPSSKDSSPPAVPFDYDATAEASLSEPPATSESASSYEPTGHSGPGWDTYSGVGNGPGWGTTPTYPPPSGTDTAGLPVIDGGYPPPHGSQGHPQQQGYPAPGYPPQGYSPPGYSAQGYSPQGYPAQGYPAQGYPYYGNPQQYPGQQYPGQQYAGQQYGPGFPVGGDAPYGRDPFTGAPLSDKSKIVAGVLQILLGWMGIGRFYIGSTAIAVGQVVLLVLGLLTVVIGIGFLLLFCLFVWHIADGVYILVGNVKDRQGRTLRD